MDIIKKIFPFSFVAKKDIVALIINIVIYIIAGIVVGAVLGLLGKIPVVDVIVSIVGGVAGLYSLCGIVFSCLDYFKVLKD